jgi:hypothetical protein
MENKDGKASERETLQQIDTLEATVKGYVYNSNDLSKVAKEIQNTCKLSNLCLSSTKKQSLSMSYMKKAISATITRIIMFCYALFVVISYL